MKATAASLGTTLPAVPAITPRRTPTHPEEGGGDTIATLIQALPEIYQPIFGHPDILASRSPDDDRIDVLCRAVGQISSHLERPLQVLDLGSAQGYIAFRLAQLGHHVTGIDAVPENVALARMIGEEHPGFDVEFIEGDIVDCRDLVDLRDFDLVIGFSVLHHVAHRDGHTSAVELVATLARHIPHALFEMALATEPVFWATSLPTDPRATLTRYPFIREIALAGTHLSDVQRPTLYASTACVLAGDELQPIESWTESSHGAVDGAHRGLRRYYFVASGIVKVTARFVDDADQAVVLQLRQEFRQEAQMLDALASRGIDAPALLEFVDGDQESILFRTTYPGVLLSEIIHSTDVDAKSAVTGQVLEALAELEAHGLYHGDLRAWNVVWDPDEEKAHLIDHGSLSPIPEDRMWPNDAYFSFLVWLVSLWVSAPDQTGLKLPRRAGIDRGKLPPRILALLSTLMVHPRDEQVFRDLSARWTEAGDDADEQTFAPGVATPVIWNWLSAIEHLADETGTRLSSERDAATAARDAALAERNALRSEVLRLESERDELSALSDEQQAVSEVLRIEREAAEMRAEAARAELAETLNTRSWRITRPLRRVRSIFRR
ncbi:MAG TPA: class I SAM-dependent methyltransferase [Acidimicrobiales bacterium]|nr:class I SAM-dependent methyltransferase [Acidimicrobiales bacterium]